MANISNSCGTSYFESEGEYTIQSCSEIGSPNAFRSIAETENEFVVYPNPSEDLITIELKKQENQSDKNQNISGELFDLTGESKSKIQIIDNKASFSVKELKKGIYVLKIFTNEQTETHEIVVE